MGRGVCQRLETDSQGLTMGGRGLRDDKQTQQWNEEAVTYTVKRPFSVQAAARLPRKFCHRLGLKGDAAPPCGGVSRHQPGCSLTKHVDPRQWGL